VSRPKRQKISSYIILTTNVKDITFQAKMLYAMSSWDNRGLFLIVVTVKEPDSEELALSIIRELWEIGRGDNVVVVVQQDDLLNLYTWFSYSSHDNCANVKQVVLINQWVMEGEGKFVREGSLYPCKTPSNFHGCTVNLSTSLKNYIEDEMFSQYIQIHNIKKNYVNNFPEDAVPLERILTCMHSLWIRESDVIFGGLLLLPEEVIDAELTFPYFAVKMNWFVPCPKPLSRIQRISHIFSPSVWIAVVVVLFLVTITSCCLAKQSNDIRSYSTMSSTLYNIWAVTVGVPVTGMPRSLRYRLLFFVFVLYCFAIGTVFQTFLTSFLVDPGYDTQLTSLDGILDSGMDFGYDAFGSIFFILSSDLRHKEVVERATLCSTSEVCIDRIRKTGNFATFAPVWWVQVYTNNINDHSTVCLLNDDDYELYFVTTYVQKGSLFFESLNKLVSLYFESGLMAKATKDTVFGPKLFRDNMDVSDGYFVFTLSHLRIAFYILFVGQGVSFLTFLCEVFYHFTLRYV
jgi:hypothetical protein